VRRATSLSVISFVLAAAVGCTVNVASLKFATREPVPADRLRTMTSRGWRMGESCRFWLLGIPSGLPQVDEAMANALAPVGGVLLRDVTVWSVHPIYVLFGWHCYRVRGEAFG
jgi:hypothetical protein